MQNPPAAAAQPEDPLRRRRAGRGRAVRRVAAATAAASLTVLLAACNSAPAASDDASSSASGGADLAFYEGKTITYITGSPGTPSAEQITALKDAMASYLKATINIKYQTTPSAVAWNQVAEAAPDGLTIGEISPLVAVSNVASGADHGGVNFDIIKDVVYIGSAYNPASLVVSCAGSPYKTFEDVVNAKQPVKVLAIPGGPASELPHLLFSGYQVDSEFITGYTPATLAQGCQRGDGDIATLGASNFIDASGTKMIDGVSPLLLSGPIPDASPNSFLNDAVPTVQQFSEDTPPPAAGADAVTIAAENYTSEVPELSTFGPAGIPQGRVTALEQAMAAAMEDEDVQTALGKAAIPPGFTSAADTLAFVKKSQDDEDVVQQYLGG